MGLIDHKAAPTPSMLRWFGLSLAILLLLIGYGLSHSSSLLGGAVAGSGIVIGCVYYLLPSTKMKIIRGWQVLTSPLAWLLGHVLLGSVYFLIFFPMGCLLRLLGYDPLDLRGRKSKSSSWVTKANTKTDRYFKQF